MARFRPQAERNAGQRNPPHSKSQPKMQNPRQRDSCGKLADGPRPSDFSSFKADFNGDGRLGLAAADSFFGSAGNVSPFLNNGHLFFRRLVAAPQSRTPIARWLLCFSLFSYCEGNFHVSILVQQADSET
jgi:hypothetical protein